MTNKKQIMEMIESAITDTEDQAKKMMEVLNENFVKTHKYLKLSPENFKSGDFFLRSPDDDGEFFKHKEKIKILSIDLPKDGKSNTAIVKTENGKDMKLSNTSLYNIARPKK